MDEISKLQSIYEQQGVNTLDAQKHSQILEGFADTQETVIKTVSSLVDFLSQNVTRTEVLNQVETIGTPDVAHVVNAVNSLHETLKTHENTDLTDVVAVMQRVLDEVAKIPKESVEIPEQEKQIDYSEQLSALEKVVKSVEKAVKAQELKVDVKAPIVNVPQAQVNVEAPDLSPLSKDIIEVKEAVTSLIFPTVDLSSLEKEQRKHTKILAEILDKPVSSGSGGSTTPFLTESGDATRVVLSQGAMPTSDLSQAVRIDDVSTPGFTYIGKALVGTQNSADTWQISRLATSSGLVKTWADGDSGFNNIWDNRVTINYI